MTNPGTPKIIIALHASICSCITYIILSLHYSFIAYHKNDLEILIVKRYHMIKFARSTCIVSR